ncbi:MAG: PD40 domain-containing protein [candidate division WOR-3 bacterium]|nr:MAG: PD40 domain-containing protein [candidate division WOR-3 bacterium]
MALLCIFLISQYFGQNKIQYGDYNFQVLKTEHFNIYFHQGGDDIVAFAEEVLEDGYAQLSEDFGMELDFTVPAILYNSPNDFAQTNVTLELLEEGIGGFTEILKNRMVVPFTGDYEEFRHLLVHELTHVFQFAVFFSSRMEALFSGDIFYSIPVWVMEGQCEFESKTWDSDADVFMKDLIMHNNVVPLQVLGNYGGYLIYKEGHAFYYYVAETYGREKTAEFVHLLKMKKNLEETFMTLFGVSVQDFNDQWIRYFQLQYWPQITRLEKFDEFARVIYDHKKTRSLYNTSTAISNRGDKIAFVSDRTGVAELYIMSSIDGRILKKLVTAHYSSGYENLHLFQGGVSWTPDDAYVTFSARAGGSDVIYVMDAQSGKVKEKYRFDLDGIYSPVFSPDGEQIAFSGMKDGYSDIYILNRKNGSISKVTDDIYTDRYPAYAPDGSIAFVSDRPDGDGDYHYGSYAVFIMQAGEIQRLVPRTSYVASPIIDPANGMFFVANYDTALNLYWFSNDSSKTVKKTDILTGIYYPTISASGDKIAFSHWNNYGYDVCVVKNPVDKMEDADMPDEWLSEFTYEEVALDKDRVRKYTPKFTFDYFTATASYYSFLGLSGLGQIGLSDILGNHHISIAADLYGSLTSSDVFLNYWYLKKRPDYGLLLFQYSNYYSDYPDLLIWRYLGAGGLVQYPLNRFFRVELGAFAYRVYETRWYDFFPDYSSNLRSDQSFDFVYPSLAFVYDNVSWGFTGPHNGRRVRLEGYATVLGDLNLRSTILDYRRYFSLSPRANFCARLVFAGSFGDDVDNWAIGGPYTLRGYDDYEFSGSKLGFLNLEYRFPFIDRFKMSVPLPIELRNVRGVVFADFGGVYTDTFTVLTTDDGFELQDVKMGLGAGLRFNFMFMIFRMDWARAHNLRGWIDAEGNRSEWKFYLTIGPDW